MMGFLRKYIFHNFGLKLGSLLASVLLWIGVARNPAAEVVITAPIEFQHVPEGLEISTESIPQAQIRVRGPARRLREMEPSRIRAVLNLQGAHPGERTYDLGGQQILAPRGIDVVQVIPTQVQLDFDQRVMRQLHILPRVIGTFASGYRLTEATVEPPVVTVIGPKKRVEALDNAVTDPVDVSGVVGHATFQSHVYVPDDMVRAVDSATVRVTVTTEKSPGQQHRTR
jgi:hypothetical protein